MSNNPPFKIGERVVCVSGIGVYKLGKVYVVGFVDQCPNCKVWNVGCITHPYDVSMSSRDCVCGHEFIDDTESWYTAYAHRFRRLDTNRHSEAVVTATELLKIEEERGVDIVPQVVTAPAELEKTHDNVTQ